MTNAMRYYDSKNDKIKQMFMIIIIAMLTSDAIYSTAYHVSVTELLAVSRLLIP
jgi:hypothetical protein